MHVASTQNANDTAKCDAECTKKLHITCKKTVSTVQTSSKNTSFTIKLLINFVLENVFFSDKRQRFKTSLYFSIKSHHILDNAHFGSTKRAKSMERLTIIVTGKRKLYTLLVQQAHQIKVITYNMVSSRY